MRSTLLAGLLVALCLGCGASRPPLPPAGAPVSAEAPVIVYGARWCQHTRAAIDYFQAHNIPSRFRDVEQNPDAWDEMAVHARAANVSTQGIPILLVRGRVLVGYHQDEVDRAIQD